MKSPPGWDGGTGVWEQELNQTISEMRWKLNSDGMIALAHGRLDALENSNAKVVKACDDGRVGLRNGTSRLILMRGQGVRTVMACDTMCGVTCDHVWIRHDAIWVW